MSKVTLSPSQHEFSVQADETILEAALRQGIALPYGCRNGACGSCKGTVLEGEIQQGAYQENALSLRERNAGMTLLCCAKPLGDVKIACQTLAMAKEIQVKTLPCRVETLEKVAHDVIVLSLKLPTNERLQFLAGQYIDILTKDGKRRSYSLANAPHDDAFLQLHLRYQANGEFSRYVFESLKPRDILRFQGPLGTFFLREDSDKPIIFIASGTGFAPVKSILEHMFQQHSDRQIIFYWGGRTLHDLYMLPLAQEWQQTHANLSFIPVLSEPERGVVWLGRTGMVHQAVLDDFDSLAGYQVYACGAPVMVEAAHTAFTQTRALPENEFFSDAFFNTKDLLKQAAS